MLGLSACATHKADPEKYAGTSCETLKALQTAYNFSTPVHKTPISDGVNEIDQARKKQSGILDGSYQNGSGFTSFERKDLNSIRAAYKKNGC